MKEETFIITINVQSEKYEGICYELWSALTSLSNQLINNIMPEYQIRNIQGKVIGTFQ